MMAGPANGKSARSPRRCPVRTSRPADIGRSVTESFGPVAVTARAPPAAVSIGCCGRFDNDKVRQGYFLANNLQLHIFSAPLPSRVKRRMIWQRPGVPRLARLRSNPLNLSGSCQRREPPVAREVHNQSRQPHDRREVVIIGAGVVGLGVAWRLAEAG